MAGSADFFNRWRYLLLLPVIVFFFFSWQKSYTGDEGLTVYLASGTYSQLISNVGADFHVPGYYTGLWVVSHIFGSSMLVFRLFSLVLVLGMIALAIKHLSPLAALFLAVSPFTLHLATEIRMYAMLALLGLLLLPAYRRFERLHNWKSLTVLVLTLSSCTWVHYFGWIGTAAVVSVLLLKKNWKHSALILISVVVLFLPWAGNVVSKTASPAAQNTQGTVDLHSETSLQERLKGMPFSIGGTALRFAGGTASFNFDLWGIKLLSPAAITGLTAGLILLVFFAKGFFQTDGISRSILLWSFLGLSVIRPSARHFAIAFPAYMVTASLGVPFSGKKRTVFIVVPVLLMILLCFPFAVRHTMPQRCTFDRDYLQVAGLASTESAVDSLPVVLFLDSYSVLGITMHMSEQDFPESRIWHPHQSLFRSGVCFYSDVNQNVSYLQHNTDSLVAEWVNLAGNRESFVLVANRPGVYPGRILGTGDNRFIGLGSDVMADLDLIQALERATSVREVDLPEDSGPLSLFVCTVQEDYHPDL